jgi:hypothetical protein
MGRPRSGAPFESHCETRLACRGILQFGVGIDLVGRALRGKSPVAASEEQRAACGIARPRGGRPGVIQRGDEHRWAWQVFEVIKNGGVKVRSLFTVVPFGSMPHGEEYILVGTDRRLAEHSKLRRELRRGASRSGYGRTG